MNTKHHVIVHHKDQECRMHTALTEVGAGVMARLLRKEYPDMHIEILVSDDPTVKLPLPDLRDVDNILYQEMRHVLTFPHHYAKPNPVLMVIDGGKSS